jgi:hypothetical protein
MNAGQMKSKTAILLSLAAGALAAGTLPVGGAHAKRAAGGAPKVVKACGITTLPISVGNTWTYEATQHPDEQARKAMEGKLVPFPAQKVTITIKAVEAKGETAATIQFTEDVTFTEGVVTLEHTATCNAKGLVLPPESFWFSGDPGHGPGLKFDNVERKGVTFAFDAKGKLTDLEWHDDVVMSWKRTATEGTGAELGSGTIIVDRHLLNTPVGTKVEPIATKAGSWQQAIPVQLFTTLEVTIDGGQGKPPPVKDQKSTYHFVDGVGPVMLTNPFIHAYQLTAYTVAK